MSESTNRICEGRVAIVTGAGRGIGREHALMLAEQGARVIVNDLGGDEAGGGADLTPAQEVVAEIDLGKNVEVICDTILKSPWRRQPRGLRRSLKLKSMRVVESVLVQDPSRAALARIPVLHAADVV